MSRPDGNAHPWIANTAPEARRRLLERVGVTDPAELYASVPARLRAAAELSLPAAIDSEQQLERHLGELLGGDRDCTRLLSFLGGGCWQHHVPALCDEIIGRAEFLTAFWADAYSDRGKYQAFFEYASLMGELLELDAVSLPTYDWGTAAGIALRMACRVVGRRRVLVAEGLGPDRDSIVANYLAPDVEILALPTDPETGTVELAALERLLDDQVAAVYFETPTYLGTLETAAPELVARAHARGALAVVGVDPISLGVLAPPASYGADLVCGELQPLGIRMNHGAGLAGFVASPDEERFVREYPGFLIGLTTTSVPGEHGFGLLAWDRTSYVRREHGKDFGGTTTGLWAIAAAVYLSLVGRDGLRELGEGILQRRAYAARRLAEIPGVSLPGGETAHFKEFPVRFEGRTAAEVNRGLLEHGILGGHQLGAAFPALADAGLYCVTELHAQADVDRLAGAIEEVMAMEEALTA